AFSSIGQSARLSDVWTKSNPWKFRYGLGAYKEDGKVIFFNKDGPLEWSALINTPEYKAITGGNIIHTTTTPAPTNIAGNSTPPVPMPAPLVLNNTDVNNIDFIKSSNESSINMLIEASKKYKAGSLTQDQYIKVALQVSQMADYYNKLKADSSTSINALQAVPGSVVTAQGQTQVRMQANGSMVNESSIPTTASTAPKSQIVAPRPSNNSNAEVLYNGKKISIKEYTDQVCATESQYVICQPPGNRLQYLRDQIAKAPKPMPINWINPFLPPGIGCPGCTDLGLDKIFEGDWKYVNEGPVIIGCDEAVTKYGMFGGDTKNLGNWADDSEIKFYDTSGKYVGTGAVMDSFTYYVNRATGEQMTEKNRWTGAVGRCRHKI
ncbi:MAG: hypothetical protein Q7U04_13865, partial [Bacteriovorax sp.]|nr:hypothetical protein [Bacteriovorax sp.]